MCSCRFLQKLIDVHNVAEKHRDLDLMDVLATEFIREQVSSFSVQLFVVNFNIVVSRISLYANWRVC